VFTERFGDFKPPEHNLLGTAIAETVFERRVWRPHLRPRRRRQRMPLGARPGLRTTGSGGVQLGHRPAVADRDRAGEHQRGRGSVVAESPQRTRVELEHRNIDRHGPGWQAVRDGVADDAGWPLYLSRYAALFTEGN